jgi:protein-arginine kinase activator protein McsA
MEVYYKSFGEVNGKVVRDIELRNIEKKGKSVITGHIGKKPVRMTMKRKLAFPINNIVQSLSKTVKRRKRKNSARRK